MNASTLLTLPPIVASLAWTTLKATALLAMTAVLVRLLHRSSAAVRHLIWMVGLGGAVALVVLSAVLPAWRVVPMPSAVGTTVHLFPNFVGSSANPVSLERTSTDAPLSVAADKHVDEAPIAPSGPAASPTPSNRPSWTTLAFALWLAGVIAIVARYTVSRVALARLASRSTPADRTMFDAQIVREMRVARPVSIRTSVDVDLPITWGIVHPQIVLPVEALEWSAECRRHVLQHELAHIRRLDAATQLVAQAASALFWFNPLAWYAVGAMRRERERACDDCVLAGGAVASDYAGDLLALVTRHGPADRYSVALAFARASHFEGRLLALLDPTVRRSAMSARSVMLTAGLTLALVAPLAAMQSASPRPVRSAEQAPLQAATHASVARTVLPPAPVATRRSVPSPVAAVRHEETHIDQPAQPPQQAADLFASCTAASPNGSSHHDSESSSDDNGGTYWMASAEFGGCSYDLKSEGQIAFSADGTSIERLSEGAYLDATTNVHGAITRFSARRAPDGTVAYQLTTSDPRPVAASVWLAQFLIGVDRTTGFDIDRRFPALVQSGGAPLVLSEIERMYSPYAKYVYARRLIQTATLDPGSLRRLAAVAHSLNTDYMAGQLITAIADRYPLSDPVVRDALLETALTMSAGHTWAQSLVMIVTKSALSHEQTLAVLESVKNKDVDYEKTRVLLAVASSQQLDGDARTAFTSAAGSVRQSYQRDRAMAALR
ncbi:MAG TPA: M56 family metallopeptidase [Gemmatimonadaceae bacterium]|nr:M56 family metallopeptidase [Gemmatimonadaceae bacterium]